MVDCKNPMNGMRTYQPAVFVSERICSKIKSALHVRLLAAALILISIFLKDVF